MEKIIGFRYKNMTRYSKNCFQKIVNKAVKETKEFLGNKISYQTVKSTPMSDLNSENVEEILILGDKREEILNELREV